MAKPELHVQPEIHAGDRQGNTEHSAAAAAAEHKRNPASNTNSAAAKDTYKHANETHHTTSRSAISSGHRRAHRKCTDAWFRRFAEFGPVYGRRKHKQVTEWQRQKPPKRSSSGPATPTVLFRTRPPKGPPHPPKRVNFIETLLILTNKLVILWRLTL